MDLIRAGVFIAELRKQQGLTQEQLGEKIGVTNKTVSRWERGVYLPPPDALLSLSQIFNVSIDEILSGRRFPQNPLKTAVEKVPSPIGSASCFSLKEKIIFYKRKWLKEHLALLFFWGVCVLGIFLCSLFLKSPLLLCASMLLLVLLHAKRNNQMMTYVEEKVYGSCLPPSKAGKR